MRKASVDGACQIIVACDVSDATNDKQQAEPLALATCDPGQAGIERPKDELGTTQSIPATLDNGYYSEAAVDALETLGFDPYIGTGRQRHMVLRLKALRGPPRPKGAWQRKVRTLKASIVRQT